jgi:plastocyanin
MTAGVIGATQERAMKAAAPGRGAVFAAGLALLFAASHARASQWFVDLTGVQFSPSSLTIAAGDQVTFINQGGNHNVVADDGSFRCAHGCDGDGHGGNGNASGDLWVATITLNEPGTVGYFCEPHGSPGAGMFGTIQVLAPAAPAAPAPAGSDWLYALLAIVLSAIAALRLRDQRRNVS